MTFLITTTLERTLSEMSFSRDQEAQIGPPLFIVISKQMIERKVTGASYRYA